MMNNSSMLREGTILRGIYRIEKQLATGGFGNTYIAINTEFDERVAIKEFFIKGKTERDETTSSVSVSNVENMQEFEEQRDKFKKEARRIRKLNNKHIIRVYDLFEENGTAYYVMDYIDGESLADRLKHKNCPMSEQEVLQILPQILDALKTVHDINLWHLDLKPANIMMDKHGQITLIDFGASKHIEKNGVLTTSSAMAKTEGYYPPEQTSQTMKNIGAWTDIYALGATLYKLLTNSNPPTFDDIINDEIDAFKFPSTVSSTIKDLIIWMMKPNRKQRPQSIDEINAFLATHGKGEAHKQDTIEETIYDEETILEPSHQKEEVGYEDTILMDDIPSKEENVVAEVEPDYENYKGVRNFILASFIAIFVSIIVYILFNRSSSTDKESNTEISTSSDDSNYGTTRVYYSWGNGNYTGDLKDGEPNGHGTIIYDDGKKFVGEFKEGKAHGKGVYTSATGEVLFDGIYENGSRVNGKTAQVEDEVYKSQKAMQEVEKAMQEAEKAMQEAEKIRARAYIEAYVSKNNRRYYTWGHGRTITSIEYRSKFPYPNDLIFQVECEIDDELINEDESVSDIYNDNYCTREILKYLKSKDNEMIQACKIIGTKITWHFYEKGDYYNGRWIHIESSQL